MPTLQDILSRNDYTFGQENGATFYDPNAAATDPNRRIAARQGSETERGLFGLGYKVEGVPENNPADYRGGFTDQGSGGSDIPTIDSLRSQLRTPTPTTPTTTTPNQSFSERLLAQVNAQYGTPRTQLSEAEIAQQEAKRVQDQIDAINRIYDVQLEDTKLEGMDRTGRASSLQVARGTKWSPYGEARTAETERFNAKEVAAVNAQRAVQIAAAMGLADERTVARVTAQAKDASEQAQNFINGLSSVYNLSIQEQQQATNEASRLATLTGFDPSGNATIALRQYLTDLEQNAIDNTYRNDQLSITRQEALAQGKEIIERPDGSVIAVDRYNPSAPPINIAGPNAKASSGEGNGRYIDPATRNAALALFNQANPGVIPTQADIESIVDIYGATFNPQGSSINPETGAYTSYNPFAGRVGF